VVLVPVGVVEVATEVLGQQLDKLEQLENLELIIKLVVNLSHALVVPVSLVVLVDITM
jgi:hypothetical protein